MTYRILFVDEIKIEVDVFIRSVKARGYDVHHCRFAQEAYDLLTTDPSFNCVLVDILLAPGRGSSRFARTGAEKDTEAGIDLVEQLIDAQSSDPKLLAPNKFMFLSHIGRSRSHKRLTELESKGVKYMNKADFVEDPAEFLAAIERICKK